MGRPVSYNVKVKPLVNDISVSELPNGHIGEGFFATSLDGSISISLRK